VPRDLLRPREHRISERKLAIVALDLGLVTQPIFFTHFRRTQVIAENNHLYLRMQQLPALQGIALDHSIVAFERLSRGEKCQQS
jgi:hypothetical protein